MQWFKNKRTTTGVSRGVPRRQQSGPTSRSGFWLAAGIVALLLLAWVLFAPDEAYIEKVAREKHGLLKKDERVYEFNRAGRN